VDLWQFWEICFKLILTFSVYLVLNKNLAQDCTDVLNNVSSKIVESFVKWAEKDTGNIARLLHSSVTLITCDYLESKSTGITHRQIPRKKKHIENIRIDTSEWVCVRERERERLMCDWIVVLC
jgi:hypothetical protein